MTAPLLQEALVEVLQAPWVLVCCDYDGTLAPIVADPEQAFPYPGVPAVLAELAMIPGIVPALVS
ncbi:MAG: trehalose-phosphatase, partial [Actinomycetia bacterium]|nr:trehalose-phosphatase [Actinomycetes bacterium]